jgi:hypothetical protein
VFRIRDILVGGDPRIRTVLLLTDLADLAPAPDPDPALFVSELQDGNKNFLFSKFLCLFLFEGTFTAFFKNKNKSHN